MVGGMAGREPDIGPTAVTVAANVKRLRTTQNLTYTQLSERLRDVAAWSITPVGVRRIEDGERRVTVDDLAALAVALGKPPAALLMPDTDNPATPVEVTGISKKIPAERVWEWLCAFEPLPNTGMDWIRFRAESWPAWRWEQFNAGEELQERKRQFDAEITRRRERATQRKGTTDGDD